MTLRFGILAYPAGHSLSPAMFNAAFKKIGIDAKYEVFEIKEDDFEKFVNNIKKRTLKIDGLSVSLPYKEKILPFLDEISEDAKKIGAVNTVTFTDGKLIGDNTDFVGAVETLRPFVRDFKREKAIILGAGGAARAIAYGLIKEGAEVTVLNRNLNKAKDLASDLEISLKAKVEFGCLDEIANYKPDILIQSTSIWLKEGLDTRIVPDEYLKTLATKMPSTIVMDIVYQPLITPLLKEALEVGLQIVTGDIMLLNQAFKQFEIWTGQKAPEEAMMEAAGE